MNQKLYVEDKLAFTYDDKEQLSNKSFEQMLAENHAKWNKDAR